MNALLVTLVAALRAGHPQPAAMIYPGAGAGGVFIGQLAQEVHQQLG